MVNFRDIILRLGRGPGLLGRGTLHCHMLIWIEGNPGPSDLRRLLQQDEGFRRRCELPSDCEVVEEPAGALPMPRVGPHVLDPRNFERREDFWEIYRYHVEEVTKCCNWHEHKTTCWSHLGPEEEPTDANCRMRIDGSTRRNTALDDESGAILLRRLHPRINDYNSTMMFLLMCNMDIQYIGSGEEAKAAIFYSSLRSHKNNERFGENDAEPREREARSLVNKMVNSMMARQELSHQQIMSFYVGAGDYYTSHKFRTLLWGLFDRFVTEEMLPCGDRLRTQVEDVDMDADVPDEDENSDMAARLRVRQHLLVRLRSTCRQSRYSKEV
ncbi:hypothetical protein CALCODRAFT_525028 [Calocera cornea HHB12733]|uniref:Helitron helicase-like domain-containing protein n=1 Tax=Calocera cornea HHB12733 TaxID=1353952 RepID=A0A165DXQ7_9BASI|nr:hypothetical protein CALCODRAFT_525028 [Calocera cornea HHB12733]